MKKNLLILFLCGLFVTGSARATVVKPVNIQTLTNLAQYIVKGEVLGKQTQTDPHESGRMVTYYTILVTDWIKGTPTGDDNEIVIKQLADGELTNNDGQVVRQKYMFPTYELHHTYVFFLPTPHHETGLLAPIGLWQGVFEVETDSQGNTTLPQLKSPLRARMLGQGMNSKTKSRFLSLDLSAGDKQDTSYGSFKNMVKEFVE